MLLLLLFCGLIVVSSFNVVGWNRPPACAPLLLPSLGWEICFKLKLQDKKRINNSCLLEYDHHPLLQY